MKIICIVSGGMDSTTMLYKLIAEHNEVKVISFYYGQRHYLELEKAKQTCQKLKLEHKTIDVSFIKDLISNSALTNDKIEVPEGHYEGENMKQTVVPNRNMIMASIAIGYAVNEEFDAVALGVHAGDHFIYPDCRPEFINKLEKVALCSNYRPIRILTPFLYIDKGDIAIIGEKLNVDYSLTLTCYKGKEIPCGKCGACVERAEAFKKAKIKDPLIK